MVKMDIVEKGKTRHPTRLGGQQSITLEEIRNRWIMGHSEENECEIENLS